VQMVLFCLRSAIRCYSLANGAILGQITYIYTVMPLYLYSSAIGTVIGVNCEKADDH
jgi:hypothetical protein